MTKIVNIGKLAIGGGNKVAVQTMTTVKTQNFKDCSDEIALAVDSGCDIVRLAVRDDEDVKSLKELIKVSPCPLVADIHFDYRLAIKSVEAGVSKIRINPGNIGGEREIKAVSDCLKEYGVPVRVGSNSGSIEEKFLKKYGRSPEALAESVLYSASLLEKYGVENIVLSAKASDVATTVKANRILSEKCDYPLHIGVTEAGGGDFALMKGAMGIGSLLLDGIGDTIRVSLTSSVVDEVNAAKNILRAAGLDKNYAEVVSCPTCGRCDYDVIKISENIRKSVKNVTKHIKIAVMGCVVNGLGEGKDADVGIAGGKDKCVIFRGGEIVKSVLPENAEEELFREIISWLEQN